MGEVADMMIDGEMCQYCGDFIGDAVGYPRSCDDCASEDDVKLEKTRKIIKTNLAKIKCPECGKKVAESGLNQHIAAKHAGEDK